MKLYMMRHCEPVPGHPMDGERDLTAEGVRQAEQMAGWLKEQIGRVDIVVSSPFKRALKTAEIMADSLGSYVVTTRLLEPDAEPHDAWKEIERLIQASGYVLVVGHDPSINNLATWMSAAGVLRFEHGSILHCKVQTDPTADPRATLMWLVTPKLVEKDEAEQEVIEAALLLVAEA